MNSRLKIGAAAGTIGIGVATLALVGTGTFASFTGQVGDNTQITAGKFHMQVASAHDPISDPAPTGVTPSTWHPTLTQDAVQITTTGATQTAKVTFTETNGNPDATYQFTVVVYNSGTLAGSVTTVVYTPTSSNALTSNASVVVEQSELDHNHTNTYETTYPMVQTNPHTPRHSVLPVATATFSGTKTEHLHFTSGTGSLDGYIQPNTHTLQANTTEAAMKYTIIVSFAKSTPNTAQGETYSFHLTFTGHVI
jgi:predicted ribosomally synthesized peptide with SipW-like signal peptide